MYRYRNIPTGSNLKNLFALKPRFIQQAEVLGKAMIRAMLWVNDNNPHLDWNQIKHLTLNLNSIGKVYL